MATSSANGIYLANRGLVAIEIEDAPPTGGWRLETQYNGFTGSGYYRYVGTQTITRAGRDVLSYTVDLAEAGDYFLTLHALRNGPGEGRDVDRDQENDFWVRVNGGEWVKFVFYDSGNFATWVWGSTLSQDEAFSQARYALNPGLNTVEISGRSSNVMVNRLHLSKDRPNRDITAPLSATSGESQAPTTSGIENIAVDVSAADTRIDLYDVFADFEDTDAELTYTVESNTNPTLVRTEIRNNRRLVLDYASTGSGVAEITVKATDTDGLSVNTTFTVTVGTANTAPTTTGIADVMVVGDAVDTTLDLFAAFADAEDADSALTYAVVGNTNPALFTGLAIAPGTGQLTLDYSGTVGTADITIRATDTAGLAAETTFTVTVEPPNTAPTTTGIADVVVTADAPNSVVELFAAFADAEDADSVLTYNITGNTNPALFDGLAIAPDTGQLLLDYTGAAGSSAVTVRATDTEGLAVETTFLVTVNGVTTPPDPNGGGNPPPPTDTPREETPDDSGTPDDETETPPTVVSPVTPPPSDDIIFGTPGRDRMIGTSDDDEMRGLGDDDLIKGRGGDDVLKGNRGNDVLKGGPGGDRLRGARNNDQLYGNAGDDRLVGWLGDDLLDGGVGNDILKGGPGNDIFVIKRRAGRDIIKDFSEGDRLGLAGGLRFGQLDAISRGNNTLIQVGDEELAILRGFDAEDFSRRHVVIV